MTRGEKTSDGGGQARSLRERLAGTTEERLGKALSELLAHSLLRGAIERAYAPRDKAAQAQELALGALNIPSAADIERLTRRLRSVSQRLEGIEDGVHRLDRALSARGVDRAEIGQRLSAIEERLGALAERLGRSSGSTRAQATASNNTAQAPASMPAPSARPAPSPKRARGAQAPASMPAPSARPAPSPKRARGTAQAPASMPTPSARPAPSPKRARRAGSTAPRAKARKR
jgi:hypothetical protein